MTYASLPDAEGAEQLAEPLRSRWSPSIFDDTHVLSDADLRTLLQAARWAPSWGNSQPASWVVAPRGSTAHAALVATLTRGNAGWVPRASAVLVGAVQVEAGPDGAAPKDRDFACYDLGQAAAHLTLQAHAMGLFAHQFAGFDRTALAAALGVPDHVRLLAGVAIGVRGDPAAVPERDREREQRVRTRRPLAELTHGDSWGASWPGALVAAEGRP